MTANLSTLQPLPKPSCNWGLLTQESWCSAKERLGAPGIWTPSASCDEARPTTPPSPHRALWPSPSPPPLAPPTSTPAAVSPCWCGGVVARPKAHSSQHIPAVWRPWQSSPQGKNECISRKRGVPIIWKGTQLHLKTVIIAKPQM